MPIKVGRPWHGLHGMLGVPCGAAVVCPRHHCFTAHSSVLQQRLARRYNDRRLGLVPLLGADRSVTERLVAGIAGDLKGKALDRTRALRAAACRPPPVPADDRPLVC